MPVSGTDAVPDELIRRVRVVRGQVRLSSGVPSRLRLRPRRPPDANSARTAHRFDGPGLSLGLAAPVPAAAGRRAWSPTSRSGKARRPRSFCAACPARTSPARCPGVGEAEELFRDTVAYWRRWLSKCTYTGRWREMVHRSALTLKLLSFEPTGAIVAAPTCSLPESIGGPRNWDYRYTWIRDAAFTLYALLRIGFTEEAARFRDWLQGPLARGRRARGPARCSSCTASTAGPTSPRRRSTTWRATAARARCASATGPTPQLQLDIYGELMDAVYLHNKYVAPVGYDAWVRLRRLDGLAVRQLETGGRGHLGGARRTAAFRLLEVHVLGRPGPQPAAGRQALVPGRPGALAEGPRRDLRGSHGPGLERRAARRSCSPSVPTPWTRRAC